MDRRLPLRGIRVLDQTIVWAGPFCSMMLGDMGAEIIRVESTRHFPFTTRGHVARPSREAVRNMGVLGGAYVDFDPGERPWNRHAVFNVTGRNKLCMTADLTRKEGIDAFMKLAAISDVVMDNSAYGVMTRLGIGYENLRRVRPDIIVISMPVFGNSGPYRQLVGLGPTADAFSSMASMHGYAGTDISETPSVFHMDAATGSGAAFAVLCALMHRQETGHGQFIDMSQVENMLAHIGEFVLDCQMNGRLPNRLGNRDCWGALQGCYPCREEDTWVVLSIRDDADWNKLQQVLDNPSWMEREEYATGVSRLRHHDEFDRLITEWSRQRTDDEAMTLLQKAGIPASKVADEAAAYEDPHILERGFFIPLAQADAGTHLYPGHLWKYARTPLRADCGPPGLGQHNEFLYKELLGYGTTEYDRLAKGGDIGDAYLVQLS